MAAHLLAQERTATRHFWYRLRARMVARFVPNDATLLDFGAGAGSLGAILENTRPDVHYRFAEPDEELAAHLRSRFGASGAHRTGASLAPPACVALLDVIEHVADDVALLREATADLPPGSRVIVTVPAFKFLWSKWDVQLGHHRRYTRRHLADAMLTAGLTDVRARYLFPELVPVALVRRIAGGGAASEDFPAIQRQLDAFLFVIGRVTQSLGGAVPLGSSVLAVGVVP